MKVIGIFYVPRLRAYIATIESRDGIRRQASYTGMPTEAEVLEDWRNPKTKKYFEVVK